MFPAIFSLVITTSTNYLDQFSDFIEKDLAFCLDFLFRFGANYTTHGTIFHKSNFIVNFNLHSFLPLCHLVKDTYVKSVSVWCTLRIRTNVIIKLLVTYPINFDGLGICARFGHKGDGRQWHFILIGSSRN